MPSIASHMAVAKLIKEKLKINDVDFIKGNLLPDIINNDQSHHKIQGKYYLIPDINYFKQKLNLNKKLELGYFTHLLLDKYFLEEYIPSNINNLKIFENKKIYKEYDLINYQLVKEFNLDVLYLQKILSEINGDIDKEKLSKNLKSLLNKETGETKYLNLDKFSDFLYNISQNISEEIRDYAS